MKRILSLLSVLVALTCSRAQDAGPTKPLLWRIDGAKPSYVFGTIHLSGPRETTLGPAVAKAVDGADALFCEVPLDAGSQMKAMGGLMSKDKPLDEALPKDLYERIEAELKHINPALSLQPLRQLHVWALTLVLPILEEQFKNPTGKPLDSQLYGRAEAAKKEVGGLETLEEQIKALSSYTPDEQLALLRGTLDDMEKARREKRSAVEELRVAYLSGDLAALDEKINESMKNLDPALAKRFLAGLLTERNHRMAERIAAKIKASDGKSFFFAIGAGHLNGDEGVLRLLEKSGLKLERLER